MNNQVYILMRRRYRWTNRDILMVPSADPNLGVWENRAKASAHARTLAAQELKQLPEECSIKIERLPQLGSERIFIMMGKRPYCVYDILQYDVWS